MVDVYFLFDMFFQFILPIQDPTTLSWIKDPIILTRRYLRGWFAADVLSIIPYDLIGLTMGSSSSVGKARYLRLLRLLRLAKLLRIFR